MKRLQQMVILVVFFVVSAVYSVNAIGQPAPRPAARPAARPAPMAVARPAARPAVRPVARAVKVAPKVAPMEAPRAAPAAMAPRPAPAMAPKAPKPMAADSAPSEAKKEAPAKPEAKPKGSGWEKADKWIDRVGKVIWFLFLLVITIVGWFKGKDWASTSRGKKVKEYFDKYFPMVEKLAAATAWKGDDKLAQLLRRMEKALWADGEKSLNPDEISLIKREAADKAAEIKVDVKKADKIDKKAVTEG